MLTVLVVWLVVVILAGVVAAQKHRSLLVWTLWAAVLPVTLLILLFVPARPDDDALAAAQEEAERTVRPCPACLAPVPRLARACRYCGRDLPPAYRHFETCLCADCTQVRQTFSAPTTPPAGATPATVP